LLPLLEFHPERDDYPSLVIDFAAQPGLGWRDSYALRASGKLEYPGPREEPTDTGRNTSSKMGTEVSPGTGWEESSRRGWDYITLRGIMLDAVETLMPAPSRFSAVEELVPFLLEASSKMTSAKNRPIPSGHRLKPLESLKHQEGIVHTFTRNMTEPIESLFHGLDDQNVWDALLRLGDEADEGRRMRNQGIFKRLSTILNGKLINRCVVTTGAGFVGIGARNSQRGDIIAFLFDTVAPVVLRPCDGHYKIVGCAYISGFMEVEWLDFYIYTGQLEETQFRIY
jgi:hypothetical protein